MRAANSKFQRAILGVFALVIAGVIAFLTFSSRWWWICLEIVAAGLVAIGCGGEWYLFLTEKKENADAEQRRRRRRELQFITAVAVGVAIEFLGLAHAIPEAFRLEKKVSEDRLEIEGLQNARIALETQLKQTETELVRLQPRNQQVVALSASAWLDTEDLQFISPNISTNVGGIAELFIHFPKTHIHDASLYSYKFSQWNGGGSEFKLGFELDKDVPSPSVEVPTGMAASDINRCFVELRPKFLPRGSSVHTGVVSVVVNSVIKKNFIISPQKAGGNWDRKPNELPPTEWVNDTIFALPENGMSANGFSSDGN